MAFAKRSSGKNGRIRAGRFTAPLFFLLALAISIAAAILLSRYVERANLRTLEPLLSEPRFDWLHVEPNGLQIELSGQAPGEIERLVALNAIRSAFKPNRINDKITVAPKSSIEPNAYTLRLLQSDGRVQIFGELPNGGSIERIIEAVENSGNASLVEDWSTRHEVEPNDRWDQTLQFGLHGIELVPDADLHLSDATAMIEGRLGSQEELDRVKSILDSVRPPFLSLTFNVTAPQPLRVPFLFDLLVVEGGARINACHVDSEVNRTRILAELAMHFESATGKCGLARGAPSPDWVDAVAGSVALLKNTNGGRIRIEGLNVFAALPEQDTTDEFSDQFNEDLIALRDRFTLHLVSSGDIERLVSGTDQDTVLEVDVSPERTIEILGGVNDDDAIRIVTSFAKAALAPNTLVNNLKADPTISAEVTGRALVGLEALSMLHAGKLTVSLESMKITGISELPDIRRRVSELLSSNLEDLHFEVNVDYDAYIVAEAPMMDPRLCASLATEVVDSQKITFEPGSANLSAAVDPTIRQLAIVLQNCTHARIEIAGHTDNQGREQMNLALSTKRARAVLDALLNEGVLTSNFVAVGYGESQPIADNGTESGREQNRRIEFRLLESGVTSIPQ